MSAPTNIVALCVGETLWDILPEGREPGGAPLNVAVQIACNGVSSGMVSRVGNDELGKELIEFLKAKSVKTDLLQVDSGKATGTVEVMLDANGSPAYDIVEDVAWDHIDESFKKCTITTQFLVFGTLASRSEKSYRSILSLIDSLPDAKKVLDLNLREPYISKEKITTLVAEANFLKVNDEEFELLKRWYDIADESLETSLCLLQSALPQLEVIILTLGPKGVMAWHSGEVSKVGTSSIEVVDTVGSGDALLGAFISQYYKGFKMSDALKFATAAGAFVATQTGANPKYTEETIFDFMNDN